MKSPHGFTDSLEYRAGFDAYHAGIGLHACPYRHGTYSYRAWWAGYWKAKAAMSAAVVKHVKDPGNVKPH